MQSVRLVEIQAWSPHLLTMQKNFQQSLVQWLCVIKKEQKKLHMGSQLLDSTLYLVN